MLECNLFDKSRDLHVCISGASSEILMELAELIVTYMEIEGRATKEKTVLELAEDIFDNPSKESLDILTKELDSYLIPISERMLELILDDQYREEKRKQNSISFSYDADILKSGLENFEAFNKRNGDHNED